MALNLTYEVLGKICNRPVYVSKDFNVYEVSEKQLNWLLKVHRMERDKRSESYSVKMSNYRYYFSPTSCISTAYGYRYYVVQEHEKYHFANGQ
jgi:hypothetical protein